MISNGSENSFCPQCCRKNKKNSIIAVFYNNQDALYTCEDKMCTYFLADTEGNLVKFNKESNTTSHILSRAVQPNTVDDELDNFFDSLDNGCNKNTGNENIFPAQSTAQVPSSRLFENNSVQQNYNNKNENSNATGNLNMEEIFKMDCSSLNLDDFLLN